MKRFVLSIALALTLAGTATAASYQIDSNHTQVHFTYKHLGYSNLIVRLNQVTGTFEFDPAKPGASSIEVQVPMSSLSSGVPKLDAHLSNADFFDVAKFPTATFKSSQVTVVDEDSLRVAGALTIHGVTRPVTLAVTINQVGAHPMRKTPAAGFDATATIKRSDFGVGGMVPAVADEVHLRISLEAQHAKPAGE